MTDPRLEEAERAYNQAVFAADSSAMAAAERGLDAVDADAALARGRLLHARYLESHAEEDPEELRLFETARRLYAALGDPRGEGEAAFWVGIVHQVIRADHDAALPLFEHSLALATEAGDDLTRSYALRHLAFVAAAAGDPATARERLTESTDLRRALGFGPGVAANLLALAYVAAAQERLDDVRSFLDEAEQLASDPEAAGVLAWVRDARVDLEQDH